MCRMNGRKFIGFYVVLLTIVAADDILGEYSIIVPGDVGDFQVGSLAVEAS